MRQCLNAITFFGRRNDIWPSLKNPQWTHGETYLEWNTLLDRNPFSITRAKPSAAFSWKWMWIFVLAWECVCTSIRACTRIYVSAWSYTGTCLKRRLPVIELLVTCSWRYSWRYSWENSWMSLWKVGVTSKPAWDTTYVLCNIIDKTIRALQ